MTPQTLNYILGFTTLFSVTVAVYNSLRNPQTKLDKEQAVAEKEMNSKAEILAQQVQWEKEANEKKFSDLQINIKDALTLAQNHTHTIDVKVDGLITTVNALGNTVTRLATILEERLPSRGI